MSLPKSTIMMVNKFEVSHTCMATFSIGCIHQMVCHYYGMKRLLIALMNARQSLMVSQELIALFCRKWNCILPSRGNKILS